MQGIGHEAGGDSCKGGGIIFYRSAAKRKKSFRKGQHDRPLLLPEQASKLLKQRTEGDHRNYRPGKKNLQAAWYNRSSHIRTSDCPLVPEPAWFLTWHARGWLENHDGLGGYEGD